jgi:diguanylate cyclase (GGDEF)-like protein
VFGAGLIDQRFRPERGASIRPLEFVEEEPPTDAAAKAGAEGDARVFDATCAMPKGGSNGRKGTVHAAPRIPDAVVSDITHLLVSDGTTNVVLEAVADALCELVPHDTLTLYRADAPVRLLRPVLVRDAYAREILAMGSVPYGAGITGVAAESKTPQLVNDAHVDPRAKQVPNTPFEPESLLAIPLLARDDLKGVLCLYRVGERNHFTIKEFKLSILFSELAALAIDNAQIRATLEAEVITDHLTALHNHRYFQERLAEELRRSNRNHTRVGLVVYDIDDFKRVNDAHGHQVGDQVLQGVASVSRETCRQEDVICRIGGEEFAIILPGAALKDAVAVAERLRDAVASVTFPTAGRISISLGVAEGPLHASSPRELLTCADTALLEAKAKGKDRVRIYVGGWPRSLGAGRDGVDATEAARANGGNQWGSGSGMRGRLAVLAARGEFRSVAQLRMLQSLSTKLNRLNDIREIGEAIAAELRSLIDYHNCRIYLLDPDGKTLMPVAFRGELTEYQGETLEALIVEVGEGLTGHMAETRRPYYTPNANEDPYAVDIPGTPELDESILGVPMLAGDRLTGAIVLSKLGVDQFDEEDMRLLEGLASNAAVAFENARLLQREHEAAELSGALLRLSTALNSASEMTEVLDQTLAAVPTMVGCSDLGIWLRDVQAQTFRLVTSAGFGTKLPSRMADHEVPAEVASHFILSMTEPFVLPKDVVATVPEEYRLLDEDREILIAPMRWEPEGLAAIVIAAPTADASFTPRDLQFARGIADITSMAMGNAGRFVELEEAYVSTVEVLANALEAKDEYTGGHARALAEMALAVGTEIQMEEERLKRLELGALFHDIGKIGVRSEIIRKPSPLTQAERREMDRHPEIGEQILAPVPFLQAIRPIVRACHERWDGKGYPDGLAGEAIPLEARIIFVCDAFHAMTTDRPYRQALPEKEAIRRIKLSAGTQFDPEVVKVFARLHAAGGIHYEAGGH